MTKNLTRRGLLQSTAVAAALAFGLTACGSGGNAAPQQTVNSDAVETALQKGGKLTVWAWDPSLKKVVEDFEAKYPNVNVNLVNAGTGNDQYTALQNAISAGSGVPDVAQIEYYALPQFALGKSLADLAQFGAKDLDGTFTDVPWSSVQAQGGVYGLPMDSGPMALFYNKELFDKHGIAVPTTWDEFLEAGRALKKADPKAYMANDTGDAGFTTSMIWQAGGKPYQVDGTNVGINFSDEGSAKFAETWQKLIDEDLLAPISSWSDEWYKGLGNGTIATLATGAWMPGNLASGVADGAGKWRVGPLPQWGKGARRNAQNGRGPLAIPP